MIDLEQEIRVYDVDSCISFKKTTETYGGLSNMASGYPIVVNGIFIRSSEALYQAMRYPNHPDIQMEIINQTSPMTAKMISKKYKGKTRMDWEQVRVPIMKWALRVKLCQNRKIFGRLLLETKDLPIVEESNKDPFWGAKRINDKFEGANVLGRLLMELRELYNKYQFDVIEPLKINNFDLNGVNINAVTKDDRNNLQINNGLFH